MTKTRFFLCIIISLFSFINANAQCFTENKVFSQNEDLRYKVFYNLGFIWVDAAEVVFNVSKAKRNGKETYHFYSYGRSYEKFDWILRVRDSYHSYIDATTLKPLKFIQKTEEGNYSTDYLYLFDHSTNRVYAEMESSDEPFHRDTISFPQCTMDLLSAVYYSRNIEYEKYEINDKIPMKVIVDDKINNIYVRYLGKETIEINDGREFRCIKFKPMLVDTEMFDSGENMTVWLSDDKNRIPVVVKTELMIGSVKVILTEAENTRYPQNAEIK